MEVGVYAAEVIRGNGKQVIKWVVQLRRRNWRERGYSRSEWLGLK